MTGGALKREVARFAWRCLRELSKRQFGVVALLLYGEEAADEPAFVSRMQQAPHEVTPLGKGRFGRVVIERATGDVVAAAPEWELARGAVTLRQSIMSRGLEAPARIAPDLSGDSPLLDEVGYSYFRWLFPSLQSEWRVHRGLATGERVLVVNARVSPLTPARESGLVFVTARSTSCLGRAFRRLSPSSRNPVIALGPAAIQAPAGWSRVRIARAWRDVLVLSPSNLDPWLVRAALLRVQFAPISARIRMWLLPRTVWLQLVNRHRAEPSGPPYLLLSPPGTEDLAVAYPILGVHAQRFASLVRERAAGPQELIHLPSVGTASVIGDSEWLIEQIERPPLARGQGGGEAEDAFLF